MKTGLLIISILFLQNCFAQKAKENEFLFSNDSTEIYFELNLKNEFKYSFRKDTLLPIFTDKNSYQNFIDSVTIDKLSPEIDFEKFEVHVKQECIYCRSTCHHDDGDYRVCHRNACDYNYLFYRKEK